MSEHIADATEMIACPFCGRHNIGTDYGPYRQWVQCFCHDCGASAASCNSEVLAIAAWNQRAGDVDLERAEAEITRLQAAITTRDAEYRDIVIELGDKQAELTALRLQVATATSLVEAQSLALKASDAELVALRALREALGGLYSHNTMIVPSCLDDPVWVAFTTAWAECEKAAAR